MIRYEKTIWENDKTPVNAQHLGKVEDGLEYLFDVIKDVPAEEDNRIANEKQRQVNETTRQNNEIKRNDTLNAKVKEVDNAIAASNSNIEEVKNKFETIVASKQQDAEVILARGKYPSLSARFDNLDKDLLNVKDTAIIPVSTENNFVTVEETTNGYLTNFKLEGKTVVVNSKNQEVEAGAEGTTLKSVGDDVDEIVVSSINDNLAYNLANVKSTDGVTPGIDSISFDAVKLEVGKTYTIQSSASGTLYYGGANCGGINANKEKTFILPSPTRPNDKKPLSIYKSNGDLTITNETYVKLSLGDKVSKSLINKQDKKKVLYYDVETQSWKKPVLREWDSIEKHPDGEYYYHKRSFEEMLKGSSNENWSLEGTGTSFKVFSCVVPKMKVNNDNTGITILCDKMSSVSSESQWFGESDSITVGLSTNNVRIRKNSLNGDLENFKRDLQQNPITIVGKLAKEEIFKCTPLDLIAFEGSTNYTIESGVVTPKISFKYEGCVGNIINTLKEKVSNLEDKLYKTNLANFTVALNALDTKLKLEQLTKTPK